MPTENRSRTLSAIRGPRGTRIRAWRPGASGPGTPQRTPAGRSGRSRPRSSTGSAGMPPISVDSAVPALEDAGVQVQGAALLQHGPGPGAGEFERGAVGGEVHHLALAVAQCRGQRPGEVAAQALVGLPRGPPAGIRPGPATARRCRRCRGPPRTRRAGRRSRTRAAPRRRRQDRPGAPPWSGTAPRAAPRCPQRIPASKAVPRCDAGLCRQGLDLLGIFECCCVSHLCGSLQSQKVRFLRRQRPPAGRRRRPPGSRRCGCGRS